MKDKFKYVFILIISLFVVWVSPVLTRADSGWDFDYDSGGSWDSSDWDSGSWSDYGDSSIGGVAGTVDKLVAFIIIVVFIVLVIRLLSSKANSGKSANVIPPEVSDENLNKYKINKDKFVKEVYDKYVNIQESWMNFDYDKLEKLVTDELFNSYSSQLKVLKLKNQKNVMSDFEFISGKITDVKEENGIRSIKVILNVKQYDYVVDADNKVLRGNDNRKNDVTYELTFVKSVAPKDVVIFPNCGAESKAVAGDNCEYCHSKIVIPPKKYVLSKKKVINQK